MKRVARTLEVSLAAYSPWVDTQGRTARETAVHNLPGFRGVIAQRVDGFARDHRTAATATLNTMARLISGTHYIGNGAQASVYRQDDEVLKVYRATTEMTDAQREAFSQERNARCEIVGAHLGVMATPQIFAQEEHPLGNYQVVVARQPFVSGRGLTIFRPNTLEIVEDMVGAYCERQESAKYQLGNLVSASFECDDETGLVPDFNGADNFRLVGDNEALRLIDVDPVDQSEYPETHDHILRQADTLALFLDRV